MNDRYDDPSLPAPRPRPRLRRPVVGLALLTAAGVGAGLAVPCSPLLPLALAGGALVLSLAFRRRAVSSPALFLGVILLAGAHTRLYLGDISPRDVARLMARPRENMDVVGVVADDPERLPGGRGREGWAFLLRLEGVRRTEAWTRARGLVRVRWFDSPPDLGVGYGQRWRLSGVLARREGGTAGHPADALAGLRLRGDAGTALSAGHGSPFVRFCLRARRACAGVLGRGLAAFPDEAALMRALLLGYREDLPERIHDAFARTGTLHIVAVSGMHVGIVAVLLTMLLSAAGVPRDRWVLVLGPALMAYATVTGLNTSAVRAGIMAVAFWSAPLLGRRPDGTSALALAAVLILAWSPVQLVDVGFVFSFAAVAGLLVLYRRWMPPVRRLLLADPWRVAPEVSWVRWGRVAMLRTASLAVASTAAWVATAPLAARYFNLVSPAALVGNLLVIPCAFLVLVSGVLSIVMGSWFVLAAEVFNHAGRVFASLLLAWVGGVARLPCSHFFVRSPPGGFLLLWYGALVMLLAARGFTRRALLAGIVFAAAVGGSGAWRGGEARVDVLDVGQGNAALVDVPGRDDVLVDAGPAFCGRRVLRHLRAKGVDRLRCIVLTHGDADHVGGASEILRYLPVDELWCSPFMKYSSTARAVLADAARAGVRVRRLARGARGFLGGVEWEVLHPDGARASRRSGDGSLVMRFGNGPASVLFMGGAGGGVERDLLLVPVDAAAGVLVVGDHGAAGTCGLPWLEAVSPAHAVVSAGADHPDGCPDADVLRRLASRGITVWRTDRDGGIEIRLEDARPSPRGGPVSRPPPVRSTAPGSASRS